MTQEAVVEQRPVVEITVTRIVHHHRKELNEHPVQLGRAGEKELEDCGEEVDLDLHRGFVVVLVDDRLEKVGGLAHVVPKFAQHENDRCPTGGVLDSAHAARKSRKHVASTVGVFAEQVLDHDDDLSPHILDVHAHKVEELVDDAIGARWHFDSDATKRLNCPLRDGGVHVVDVLGKLLDELVHIFLVRELGEDVKLDKLDVRRLVEVTIELLELVIEDAGAARDHDVNVLEDREANLVRRTCHERQHGLLEAQVDLVLETAHHVRVSQKALGCCKDHCAVRNPKAAIDDVHDGKSFLLGLWPVLDDETEHSALAPLVELADAIQQVHDEVFVRNDPAFIEKDLAEHHEAACRDLRVTVANPLAQSVHHAALLDG
mmetsp:Transcript_9834/g.27809  ORF Transcript_9834/g.27809 Transcript_9834/m.27809 type:complete len:375 (-) Transcript_9834:613-1737(-)